ncbi:hypothetical protein C7974DRAFT_149001 [Boeremia exigua]|uniref:uncharacterized protein n=1 Tax=Boeremia exigua TaxID=749465 RepID=UPI001E8D35D6|nr:uncharacterized protein C7974DRAFT_149001 [Boeremia exigua]KAH6637816.1 hypothetical protein C7974DRAFT_149001 [Boeremia exigua]
MSGLTGTTRSWVTDAAISGLLLVNLPWGLTESGLVEGGVPRACEDPACESVEDLLKNPSLPNALVCVGDLARCAVLPPKGLPPESLRAKPYGW